MSCSVSSSKRFSDIRVLIDRIRFADGNIGEEAILASLLQDLEACGITRISVLSNQPEITRIRHPRLAHVIPDEPKRWAVLPFEVKKFDMVIWGGGHMLQDRSSQLHIPFVVKTLLLAKFFRVRRFVYAPGLGPVVNRFGKLLSKLALKDSNTLIVRDVGSVDFLKSIGINQQVNLTADPAFSLKTPADDSEHYANEESPIIGFAPRKHFYRKGSIFPMNWQMAAGDQHIPRFERYLQDAAAVLDLLIEQRGARVRLIPMDITPNPRDDLVCHRLKDYMVNTHSVEVWDDNPPLDDFIRRLIELDLLVSARLHGIILGLRFGLPFIGIDSDGKIEQMTRSIGYNNYLIKDINFDRGIFYNLAQRALDQRNELRQDLLRHEALMRERSNENRILLQRCLHSIHEEQ